MSNPYADAAVKKAQALRAHHLPPANPGGMEPYTGTPTIQVQPKYARRDDVVVSTRPISGPRGIGAGVTGTVLAARAEPDRTTVYLVKFEGHSHFPAQVTRDDIIIVHRPKP